jgi:hypothetical protein
MGLGIRMYGTSDKCCVKEALQKAISTAVLVQVYITI